jgi:hypothetical protein
VPRRWSWLKDPATSEIQSSFCTKAEPRKYSGIWGCGSLFAYERRLDLGVMRRISGDLPIFKDDRLSDEE